MSRAAGPACQALRAAIAAGVTGSYHVFAQVAGLEPEKARATLKEMSRRGEGAACDRGARGAPAVYGPPAVPPIDVLAHARQAWR